MSANSNARFLGLGRGLRFSASAGGVIAALLVLASLSGCSSDFVTDGEVLLDLGQESDAWAVAPAAKNVLLELVQTTKRTTLTTVAAPATSITIGTEGPQNAIASFEATAFDANGNVVMKGSTVPLGILGFAGAQIPLFIGRTGGLSRAPGNLVFPWRHPQAAVLYHGYLLISGGDDASANLDVYDVAHWGAAPQQPSLPKAPRSWAISGSKILLIDHSGAIWLDFSDNTTSSVELPVDLALDHIVGGQTFGNPGDAQYIVGATRASGEPTDQVLRVDPDATLHLLKLNAPRLGAAAATVNKQLLVIGGSETGAGAEVSNDAGTGFSELPFPSDATQGAALVVQGDSSAFLAGGRDPANDQEIVGFRTMDLSCTEDCTQVAIKNADFAFDYPHLFSLGDRQLLAVGEDPKTQETHVFTFDTGLGHALNEFALRTPRNRASAFLLPNGQVGVVGGDAVSDGTAASSVELFFPQP